MLRVGGRSQATVAMPVVQRVVERVLHFQQLFAGKSKWKIRIGNKLRDMGLGGFLCNLNFHYVLEGALGIARIEVTFWV